MSKYVPTPEEIKLAEAERKLKQMEVCESCGKCAAAGEYCNGLCQACMLFFLDDCGQEAIKECAKDFGIDLPDDIEGEVFDD